MKLALVGVGRGGTRIVDAILQVEADDGRDFCNGDVLAFDTAPLEVDAPNVPEDRRMVIGETHPDVEGNGVDGDPDLAAAATREDINEIRRAFDDVELYEVDAVLLVAGLGGGTGAGTGSVLVEELQTVYDVPTYVLGVLPAEDEGGQRALNAARALRSVVPTADNVVLFDNHAWYDGEGELEEHYDDINRALAIRIASLFGAGELASGSIAEQRIDSSDITRTLATGGVSSIGHASIEIERSSGWLPSWLRQLFGSDDPRHSPDAAKIKGLIRRATNSRLTLPCEIDSADRVAVVLSGPPGAISRKGFETARHWLEQETDTVEVLAGDEPRKRSSSVTATVLFSNVTDVPGIDAMQAQAVATQERSTTKAITDDA